MFRNLRISTKLLLAIIPFALLAIGISVYLNNFFQERAMLEEAQITAQTYTQLVRESLVEMMETRQQIDDQYLRQLSSMQDIHDLVILFRLNNLALKDVYQTPERLARLEVRERNNLPTTDKERSVFASGDALLERDGEVITALIPFKAVPKCQQCHSVPLNHVLGVARMNVSLARVSSAIKDNWMRSLWVFLGFTFFAGSMSILVYRRIVDRRLKSLFSSAHVIGSGNLDEPLELVSSKDEFGEIASALDTMRLRLKKAQEQIIHSERLSTIGQMASSIIHDFRSPMSTINLAIETLEEGDASSPEKKEQWYQLIRESISRMVAMAQELLDFSRGESHLQKIKYSVDTFMKQLTESARITLERSGIRLIVDEEYAASATFDPERMHRALVNIINNAQDAMPNGGTLRISSHQNNGSIQFRITDSGPGIPAEIKERIFDPFFTSGKKRGTGLGLAITKRIVDQHGGTISVESERGKGTTFTVNIPIS